MDQNEVSEVKSEQEASEKMEVADEPQKSDQNEKTDEKESENKTEENGDEPAEKKVKKTVVKAKAKSTATKKVALAKKTVTKKRVIKKVEIEDDDINTRIRLSGAGKKRMRYLLAMGYDREEARLKALVPFNMDRDKIVSKNGRLPRGVPLSKAMNSRPIEENTRLSGAGRRRMRKWMSFGYDMEAARKLALRGLIPGKSPAARQILLKARRTGAIPSRKSLALPQIPQDPTIKMGVLPYDYPNAIWANEDLKKLEEIITKSLKNKFKGEAAFITVKPKVGYLMIICQDRFSADCLVTIGSNMRPFKGSKVKVVEKDEFPQPEIFYGIFPLGKSFKRQSVLDELKAANSNLSLGDIRIIHNAAYKDSNKLILSVDPVSSQEIADQDLKITFRDETIQLTQKVRPINEERPKRLRTRTRTEVKGSSSRRVVGRTSSSALSRRRPVRSDRVERSVRTSDRGANRSSIRRSERSRLTSSERRSSRAIRATSDRRLRRSDVASSNRRSRRSDVSPPSRRTRRSEEIRSSRKTIQEEGHRGARQRALDSYNSNGVNFAQWQDNDGNGRWQSQIPYNDMRDDRDRNFSYNGNDGQWRNNDGNDRWQNSGQGNNMRDDFFNMNRGDGGSSWQNNNGNNSNWQPQLPLPLNDMRDDRNQGRATQWQNNDTNGNWQIGQGNVRERSSNFYNGNRDGDSWQQNNNSAQWQSQTSFNDRNKNVGSSFDSVRDNSGNGRWQLSGQGNTDLNLGGSSFDSNRNNANQWQNNDDNRNWLGNNSSSNFSNFNTFDNFQQKSNNISERQTDRFSTNMGSSLNNVGSSSLGRDILSKLSLTSGLNLAANSVFTRRDNKPSNLDYSSLRSTNDRAGRSSYTINGRNGRRN